MHVYSCFSSWVVVVAVVVFRLCSVPTREWMVAHLRPWRSIIIIILSFLPYCYIFHSIYWQTHLLSAKLQKNPPTYFEEQNSLLCHIGVPCLFGAKSFCCIVKSIDSMYHKTDSCFHRWVASRHMFIEPIAFTLHSSLFCILVKLRLVFASKLKPIQHKNDQQEGKKVAQKYSI